MLSLFEVVDKKPGIYYLTEEILLLGAGGSMALFPPVIRKYVNDLGIQLEVLSSKQAASTYNVLAEEGRLVALAILPPIPTSSRTGKVLVELQSSDE